MYFVITGGMVIMAIFMVVGGAHALINWVSENFFALLIGTVLGLALAIGFIYLYILALERWPKITIALSIIGLIGLFMLIF